MTCRGATRLIHDQLDQRAFLTANGGIKGGGELIGCGHGKAGDAVCLGKRRVVCLLYTSDAADE